MKAPRDAAGIDARRAVAAISGSRGVAGAPERVTAPGMMIACAEIVAPDASAAPVARPGMMLASACRLAPGTATPPCAAPGMMLAVALSVTLGAVAATDCDEKSVKRDMIYLS